MARGIFALIFQRTVTKGGSQKHFKKKKRNVNIITCPFCAGSEVPAGIYCHGNLETSQGQQETRLVTVEIVSL